MKQLEWHNEGSVISARDYRVFQRQYETDWHAMFNSRTVADAPLPECLSACQSHADSAVSDERMREAYPLAIKALKAVRSYWPRHNDSQLMDAARSVVAFCDDALRAAEEIE